MNKRIKLKSFPRARCGTMLSVTARDQRNANTAAATCVQLSKELHHLHDDAWDEAWQAAVKDAGFVFKAEVTA